MADDWLLYTIKSVVENEGVLPKNRWLDSMIWCPSQCYMHVVDDDGNDYVLYLRWRHEDPWQGHIIAGASNYFLEDGEWSPDLFEQHDLHFADDDVDDAKAAIAAIWRDMYGNYQK